MNEKKKVKKKTKMRAKRETENEEMGKDNKLERQNMKNRKEEKE